MTSTTPTPTPTMTFTPDIQCERCGRCLTVCPVYQIERVETLSPRGRLDLIRAVAAGEFSPGERYETAIHSCLQCLACADACPKGVDGAHLIQSEKATLIRHDKHAGLKLEALGLKMALRNRGLLASLAFSLNLLGINEKRIPELHPQKRITEWPEVIEPLKGRALQDEITLFPGCFFGFLDTRPFMATIRVLRENGIRIHLPKNQVCCGAPALLSGHSNIAMENRRKNLEALAGDRPVLTFCATCGNTLKNEYTKGMDHPHPLEKPAKDLATRVKDVTEYLAALKPFKSGPNALNQSVVIHNPCHLNRGMQLKSSVARFLERLPGLKQRPLKDADHCCGGGGLCAFKNPEVSKQLGAIKARNITDSGAQLVTAPCPGCLIQIRSHLADINSPLRSIHPLELAARTYIDEP